MKPLFLRTRSNRAARARGIACAFSLSTLIAASAAVPGTAQAQTEAAAAPSPDVSVHYTPSEPGLVLSLRAGEVGEYGRVLSLRTGTYYGTTYTPVYQSVCEGECTHLFALGTQRLAIGKKGGTPVEPASPILISGPSTLHGELTDRSGARTAGTVIGIAGGVGFGGLALYELITENSAALGFAGLGGMILSLIVGSVLALETDEATFTITPLGPSAPSAPVAGQPTPVPRESSSAVPHGGALSVRF